MGRCECARQILADCQAAIDIPTVEEWGWRSLDKENYRHVMTKAICAAIRSQISLYAASPLYNDGTITWTEAAEITKKSLDDCLANNYELYKKQPNATAGYSPYDVYFYSRTDLPVVNDKETIMEVGQCICGIMLACQLPTARQMPVRVRRKSYLMPMKL